MKTTDSIKVVPARYPMRTVGAVIALFALAVILQSVAFNPRWEWSVFARWFFDPVILSGLGQTLLLTLIGTLLSILIGGLLALARLSSSWLLNCLAWGYIWLFRSLPLIVVLIVLYNFSYLYDTLTIGIPFTPIQWGSFETINVLGQFSTAVVGLTLVQSAYTAEIIRGGFLGVDHGQYEAAAALGLPAGRRTLRIILPQALRTILPAGFNEIISLAKGTAMVYVLAMPELFYTIQMIYNRTQEVIPLLMVGAVWYLVITSILSLIQHLVERALARSERRSAGEPCRKTQSSTSTAGGRPCPTRLKVIFLLPASANTLVATKHWIMCRWRSLPERLRSFSGRPVQGNPHSCVPSTIWNASMRVLFKSMAITLAIVGRETSCMS